MLAVDKPTAFLLCFSDCTTNDFSNQ